MTAHRLSAFAVALTLLIAAPASSFADMRLHDRMTLSFTHNYAPSPWTEQMGYVHQSGGKLAFGGINLLLGWMELYNEPRDAARAHESIMPAMGRGLVNTVGDMLGGAMHVVTFPITALDVPLPEGGTDIL